MRIAPTFTQAARGGFAGTLLMTAMMYIVGPAMGMRMDIAGMLGSMLGGSWMAGFMMHVVNGTLIFPGLYAFVAYERLPGAGVARGVTFGVLLWLVAQVVVMPMMGAGVFSAGRGGMVAAVGSLLGHLLYGVALGSLASPGARRVAVA